MVGNNPRVKFAGIPRRFEGASLVDFKDADFHQTVSAWLFKPDYWSCTDMGMHGKHWTDQNWRCMVINGPVGVGKTHLACAMVAEYCKRRNAMYTTAYSMSRRIMADKGAEHFNKQSLLVIDEVNRTFDTKAERDRFFDLVNYRYENEMPMVLVGNIQTSELKELLGEAVADRIRENVTVNVMNAVRRDRLQMMSWKQRQNGIESAVKYTCATSLLLWRCQFYQSLIFMLVKMKPTKIIRNFAGELIKLQTP
jgi:hypothetical protein